MSFSDFLVVDLGTSNGVLTGSSKANNELSNPLTSSDQCRVWNEANQGDSYAKGVFFISSSVSGGNLVNIPATKSVSMRVWGRIENGACVVLLAKNSTNTNTAPSFTGNQNGGVPNSGYQLNYNQGNGGRFMFAAGGVNSTDIYSEYEIVTGLGSSIWLGVRMDIIPVSVDRKINGVTVASPYKDIIKIYKASVSDPDNWILVDTKEYTTDNSRYVPWGSYTIKPNGQASGQTVNAHYGFGVRQNGQSRAYVDDFKIFVKDAF